MDKCVNGIPNQVNLTTAGSVNANQVEGAYVDTSGPNTKFSSGFKARHDILFNQQLGTVDSSVSIVPNATGTVRVVFKLMLSYIFMSLKSCNKVFRGGQITITLNKDSNIYKAFNIDRTPLTGVADTTATTNNAIQTWPPAQAANTGNWTKYYNNVSSPWVDLSNAAPMTGI
jgi:hypothetical protein